MPHSLSLYLKSSINWNINFNISVGLAYCLLVTCMCVCVWFAPQVPSDRDVDDVAALWQRVKTRQKTPIAIVNKCYQKFIFLLHTHSHPNSPVCLSSLLSFGIEFSAEIWGRSLPFGLQCGVSYGRPFTQTLPGKVYCFSEKWYTFGWTWEVPSKARGGRWYVCMCVCKWESLVMVLTLEFVGTAMTMGKMTKSNWFLTLKAWIHVYIFSKKL